MLTKIQSASLWLAFFMLSISNAFATDIQCNKAELQKYEEIICDYSILNNQYEKIFKQQEELIGTAHIPQNAIDSWRKKRDSCTDVPCMDSVFAEWKATMASIAEPDAIQRQEVQSLPVQSTVVPDTSKEQSPSVPYTDASQEGENSGGSVQRQEALPSPDQPQEQQGPGSDNSSAVVWILLLGGIVWTIRKIHSTRCLECKKYFARRQISKEKIFENTIWEEAEREEVHRDRNGQKIGSTFKKKSVPITVTNYRVYYCCNNCDAQWDRVVEKRH